MSLVALLMLLPGVLRCAPVYIKMADLKVIQVKLPLSSCKSKPTYICTAGEQETRAWTIKDGFTAPQAAGVIHSDFERGFIRAETVSYNQYTQTGGFGPAREKGVLRLEGKEYIVQEGDVMLFRFNV